MIKKNLTVQTLALVAASTLSVFPSLAADKEKPGQPPEPKLELKATPSANKLCVGTVVTIDIQYFDLPQEFEESRVPIPNTSPVRYNYVSPFVRFQLLPTGNEPVSTEANGTVTQSKNTHHGIFNSGSVKFTRVVAKGPNVWKFTYGAVGHNRNKAAKVAIHRVEGYECKTGMTVPGTHSPANSYALIHAGNATTPKIDVFPQSIGGIRSTTRSTDNTLHIKAVTARRILTEAIDQMIPQAVSSVGYFDEPLNEGPETNQDAIDRIKDQLSLMTQPDPVETLPELEAVFTPAPPSAQLAAAAPVTTPVKAEGASRDNEQEQTRTGASAVASSDPDKATEKPPVKTPPGENRSDEVIRIDAPERVTGFNTRTISRDLNVLPAIRSEIRLVE